MEDDIDDLEITDRAADWNSFLTKHYRKELGEISAQYPHLKSLEIDYRELSNWGKTGLEIADEILHTPGKVIGGDVKDAIRNHNLIFTKDESENADTINIRFRCLPKKSMSVTSVPTISIPSSRLREFSERQRKCGRG